MAGKTENYNHKTIEPKWQKWWLENWTYSPDLDTAKEPFYNLFMFPYPSAEGMHAGHAMSSTGSDIYGRFMRMKGKDVFQPMGYDSFGIHSENYAIKIGEKPQVMLKRAIKHFSEQFKSFGHGYDWSRTLATSDINYYKWTQWIFTELFKAGLAYRKKSEVNWCPGCKTVLADEQIMTPAQAAKIPVGYKSIEEAPEGIKVCERCGNIPEKRDLEQWFFRITDYADQLLDNLKKIDWSEKVLKAQNQWIGKSKGMLIRFKLENSDEDLEVFTTRPDTLNAVTFIAVADDALYNKYKDSKEKFGEFTGNYAVNPLTKKRIPIWKTNYVASGYGTGSIMGVPAHDERDADFAKKYHIDIVKKDPDKNLWKEISEKGWGKLHSNYHLRDWLISRQRYWGPPIPMIYCENCARGGKSYFTKNKGTIRHDQSDWNPSGWYPEENLPVELPEINDFLPKGGGRGPLADHPEFYKVKCPSCGKEAVRETDVSDTFLDSSWYFFRYTSTDDKKNAWNTKRVKKWLPVSLYFGGAEHAVLHLMYARFMTMVFKDLKLISFEEPFPKFYAHGLMIKDGAKMSKSRGNVVNPDDYIKKFGADTLRMYLVFIGPMDGSPDFRDTGIEGMHRFIKRIWSLYQKNKLTKDEEGVKTKMHQTIQKVTKDIETFHYNTGIASIMEFVNFLKENGTTKESLTVLCQLIAPFAPHIAEEIWHEVLENKDSVHRSIWPQYDSKYLKVNQYTVIVQVNGKIRDQYTISKLTEPKEEIIKSVKGSPKLTPWIKGKKIVNTIYVPGKILNFVTANAKN